MKKYDGNRQNSRRKPAASLEDIYREAQFREGQTQEMTDHGEMPRAIGSRNPLL
jgi:hypothetical protein